MSQPRPLRGLTWDHPRAVSPLRASLEPLRLEHPEISLAWDVQSLAAFEARPIEETARHYDLIVFDHPHVGEIAQMGLFRTADAALQLAALSDADFVGPSLASYRYQDQLWGLPLDAACQVMCARPDLLRQLEIGMPTDWAGVLAIGEQAARKDLYLAIAFAGVHSLMTLLSLCANLGCPLSSSGPRAFPERTTPRRALQAMTELLNFCPPQVLDWNSIGVQDAMCVRNDLVLCPMVYGFSPYASSIRVNRLEYGDFPGFASEPVGSTLGGAGIGVSAHCRDPDAAFTVARFLISARVQESIIATHEGQPASTAAWESQAINRRNSGFYAATRRTIQRAWVRPRFNGYLHFQRTGGMLVESHLRGAMDAEVLLDKLDAVWIEAQSGASVR